MINLFIMYRAFKLDKLIVASDQTKQNKNFKSLKIKNSSRELKANILQKSSDNKQ